jgi:hypothetical protein
LDVKAAGIEYDPAFTAVFSKAFENAVSCKQRRDYSPLKGEATGGTFSIPNFAKAIKVAAVDRKRSIEVQAVSSLGRRWSG